jgi:hypothetical protein
MIATVKYFNANILGKVAGALSVALLSLASTNASAEVSKTVANNGAMVSKTAPAASTVIPDAQPKIEEALPAGATVIYSNFGSGSSTYNAGSGFTEAGQEANDYPLAEAMSFTPASDFLLVRIDAALTYVTGTNGVHLVLAEDNGGLPGTIIYSKYFTNLPTFGTCCVVQTAKLTPSKTSYVALAAGKTYWLYPLPADTTSYLVWNQDTTNAGGNGAVSEDYGSVWTTATLSPFGAFDLYGITVSK